MSASMISEWRSFRRGQPGRRFIDRYESSRRTKDRRNFFQRLVWLVIALAALAVGVVLMFIPGPAVLFFFIGGSLLAAESRHVAKLMDWSEVEIRKVARWLWKRWNKLSKAGKISAVLAASVASGAVLVAGYRLWIE